MSVKTIEKIRGGKPFHFFDLFVYLAIAVIVIVLFCVFVFARDAAELTVLYAECDGVRLLTYDFPSDTLTVGDDAEQRLTVDDGETLTVTIRYNDTERYNTLVIDKAERSARIADANCSAHKDCVHSAAITQSGDVIVCVPHRLKIVGGEQDLTPSLG